MADTKRTPGDEPNPATGSEPADAVPEEAHPSAPATDAAGAGTAPAKDSAAGESVEEASGEKAPETKPADEKTPAARTPGRKARAKAPVKKTQEKSAAEKDSPDAVPGEKAPDAKVPNDRTPEAKAPAGKAPHGSASDDAEASTDGPDQKAADGAKGPADPDGAADGPADPATPADAADPDDAAAPADAAENPAAPTDQAGPQDPDDDRSDFPYPTRKGWVIAAFLLFWPLAIPAFVLSMRTAEANGTGNVRRAKKASVRTLDFALGAVTVGVLGIVALALGIAAAPAYASSLPAGFVSAARSFVPPALAGPLGITVPDDGPELTAPTPSPTDDPYATGDPYAPTEPTGGAEASTGDSGAFPTPEDADGTESTGDDAPPSDTTATTGAEIPDLAVGDCIDTAATSGQSTLYRIPVVPCTTAHGGEIYAETTAPDSLAEDGEAPTQQALWDAADAYCYPEFAKFVGTRWAKSELLYWPIAPSEESWAEDDRRILCVVESEELVTGSLEGADR